MKSIVALLCLVCFSCFGCATERAMTVAGDSIKATAAALSNKLQVTQSSASVSGRINNPEYDVFIGVVTGYEMRMRLVGVEANGQIAGSGSGNDRPLSDADSAAIRNALLKDDSFLALLRQLQEKQQ